MSCLGDDESCEPDAVTARTTSGIVGDFASAVVFEHPPPSSEPQQSAAARRRDHGTRPPASAPTVRPLWHAKFVEFIATVAPTAAAKPPARTGAERQRAYRDRLKARMLDELAKRPARTGAERSRDYRDRLKAKREPKPPARTGAERSRDYRDRLKAKCAQPSEPSVVRADLLESTSVAVDPVDDPLLARLASPTHPTADQRWQTNAESLAAPAVAAAAEQTPPADARHERTKTPQPAYAVDLAPSRDCRHRPPPRTDAERQRDCRARKRAAAGGWPRPPPKTDAERQRDYRNRKRATRSAQAKPKAAPRTGAERQRDYRERKRAAAGCQRAPPKTDAERQREYRDRKKRTATPSAIAARPNDDGGGGGGDRIFKIVPKTRVDPAPLVDGRRRVCEQPPTDWRRATSAVPDPVSDPCPARAMVVEIESIDRGGSVGGAGTKDEVARKLGTAAVESTLTRCAVVTVDDDNLDVCDAASRTNVRRVPRLPPHQPADEAVLLTGSGVETASGDSSRIRVPEYVFPERRTAFRATIGDTAPCIFVAYPRPEPAKSSRRPPGGQQPASGDAESAAASTRRERRECSIGVRRRRRPKSAKLNARPSELHETVLYPLADEIVGSFFLNSLWKS